MGKYQGFELKATWKRERALSTKKRRISSPRVKWDVAVRVSPDGCKIVFESTDQIFIVDADGQGEPRQLTTGKGTNTHFQISPDGTSITFKSNRDGNWEIYLTQTDGVGEKRLTQNPGYDGHPVWLDSNRIGFVSDREDKPVFCVMDKEGSIIMDIDERRIITCL